MLERAGRAGLVVASYLAGAFPTAELVGRAVGHDVHSEGSGNPGASNTFRLAGKSAGAFVLAADLAKGALPPLAAIKATRSPALAATCGTAAVAGHCFPLLQPAGGGKGVATAAGMVLVVDPPLGLLGAAAWAGVAKATRRPSVASVVLAIGLPVAALARHRPGWELASFALVGGLVLARHEENLRRLARGEERPVSQPAGGPRPIPC